MQGATPLEAALQTSPWTLAPMVVAPLAGFIAPRVGTRALIVAGLARARRRAVLADAACSTPTVAYPAYVAPFIVAGIGMGLVFAPSATAVLAHMAPDDHAKASGTNSMLREVGVALGIAVSTAVFTGAGGELTPVDYAVGAAARGARRGRSARGVGADRPAAAVGQAVKAVPRRRQPPSPVRRRRGGAPVPVGSPCTDLRPDPYDGGPVRSVEQDGASGRVS